MKNNITNNIVFPLGVDILFDNPLMLYIFILTLFSHENYFVCNRIKQQQNKIILKYQRLSVG